MVVIEVEPSEVKPKATSPTKRKPGVAETSARYDGENKPTTAAAAAVEGYASDGFETASESDVINDEQINRDDDNQSAPSSAVENHSYHDSLNDDQLQQKALEDANDAKLEGNKLFGSAQFEDALLKYDLALQLVNDMPLAADLRSICHANRATCFFKLGKYEDSIKECKEALELNPSYIKPLLRRAEAHEKLENFEEAVADMTKVLELDPSNLQAKRSVVRLEPLAREKREKMKEEMIGKLKDVGNSILGKFGMSVDNFKAVQDPKTGSYSISFQR